MADVGSMELQALEDERAQCDIQIEALRARKLELAKEVQKRLTVARALDSLAVLGPEQAAALREMPPDTIAAFFAERERQTGDADAAIDTLQVAARPESV